MNEVVFILDEKYSEINENMKYNYHAIALEKFNISEADRLYTFFTLERGLIRVPAKSVRKSKAKLAAQVEDFVFSHITIAKGCGRGVLSGAVVEKYFVELHQNYWALQHIDRVRIIFLSIIEENDSDERIFWLWANYLEELNHLSKKQQKDVGAHESQFSWITHAFLIQLFILLGYDFATVHCCVCYDKINEIRNGFSAAKGGVLCSKCFCSEYFCYIEPDTIKAIRIIQTNKLQSLAKVTVHDDVYKQLDRIVYNIEKWIMR